jgi:hypothetical protein
VVAHQHLGLPTIGENLVESVGDLDRRAYGLVADRGLEIVRHVNEVEALDRLDPASQLGRSVRPDQLPTTLAPTPIIPTIISGMTTTGKAIDQMIVRRSRSVSRISLP